MSQSPEETPVLIVGGSLVGLSTAVFLGAQSKHPIHPIVIERHHSHSLHPRAIDYTPRTMEMFCVAGIADKVPAAKVVFKEVRRAKVESLAGERYEESSWTPEDVRQKKKSGRLADFSPTKGSGIAQDVSELILRG